MQYSFCFILSQWQPGHVVLGRVQAARKLRWEEQQGGKVRGFPLPQPHQGYQLAGQPAGDVFIGPDSPRRAPNWARGRPSVAARTTFGILRHQAQQGQARGVHGIVDGGVLPAQRGGDGPG